MVAKLKKKRQNKKTKVSKNVGQIYLCHPIDVMKRLPQIKEVIDKALPTIDILTFDDSFTGLKDDISKYIRKGLRMNQLVMAIDKKFKAFDTNSFFENRVTNIQRRLSIEIYTLIKGFRNRVQDSEIEELLEETKEELINSFLIPLIYYDHKVEITLIVEDVKVIFTFKDRFKHKKFKVGSNDGCMFMLSNKNEFAAPLIESDREHTEVSYRVVQSKQKVNSGDEPVIEARLLFDGSPAIFGYYSI